MKISKHFSWLIYNRRILQEVENEVNSIITRKMFLDIWKKHITNFIREKLPRQKEKNYVILLEMVRNDYHKYRILRQVLQQKLDGNLIKNGQKFLPLNFEYKESIINSVLEKDYLLVTPYHSFLPVIKLFREVSIDENVESIKLTIYRLAPDSEIIKALEIAIKNGKKVTAIIERKAKGDEENNRKWKEILRNFGAKVIVNRGKKLHAKFCIIKRKNDFLGLISTGNFNEETAKTYSDIALFTANQKILRELNKVFNALKKKKNPQIFRKNLMLSPNNMRNEILAKINREISEAKKGRKAHIILKANGISDKKIIKKLYQAAKYGVKIQMIIRGIYCLINKENFKHKIQSISIVDEYLEHSRIMYFYNGGAEDIYISSADWMKKNFDSRVEIAVKIEQENLKNQLKEILHIYLKDNIKARILEYPFENNFVENDIEPIRSQQEIFRYLNTQK